MSDNVESNIVIYQAFHQVCCHIFVTNPAACLAALKHHPWPQTSHVQIKDAFGVPELLLLRLYLPSLPLPRLGGQASFPKACSAGLTVLCCD